VAVSLWGLAPVATRAAVGHLAPLPLLVLRLTVASLVMLPWAVPVFRRLRPRSAGRLLAAGILGMVGYNLPVTIGLRWLPASTAGLLLATEPVWVMLLGRVFLAERGGARTWLGSAVALSGVAVLAGPGALAGADGYRGLAGAGLVLAGTLAFGGYTIVLRPLSQAHGAIPATAASTVIGTLPYLAFAGTLSWPALAHLDPAVWGEIAFLALGSTTAGLLLWNLAVLSGGTTRVSLLLYLEPVVSVLGAAAFLGEHVKPVTIVSGLLILAGVTAASSSLGGVASRHGRDDAFHQTGGMPGAGTAGADGVGVNTRARGRGGRSGRRREHHRHGAGSCQAGQAAGRPGGTDIRGSRGELPDRRDRPGGGSSGGGTRPDR
jgi:drug/metabolite transporter (DMT)-like permease